MNKFVTPTPITAVLDIPTGRVRFFGPSGSIEVTVQLPAGSRVEAKAGGTVVLRTQMGNVSVSAAACVSASLDAGTAYGRITNTLKNDGTAALNIHATTAYGDIDARSR
jgi:hypothetical protein